MKVTTSASLLGSFDFGDYGSQPAVHKYDGEYFVVAARLTKVDVVAGTPGGAWETLDEDNAPTHFSIGPQLEKGNYGCVRDGNKIWVCVAPGTNLQMYCFDMAARAWVGTFPPTPLTPLGGYFVYGPLATHPNEDHQRPIFLGLRSTGRVVVYYMDAGQRPQVIEFDTTTSEFDTDYTQDGYGAALAILAGMVIDDEDRAHCFVQSDDNLYGFTVAADHTGTPYKLILSGCELYEDRAMVTQIQHGGQIVCATAQIDDLSSDAVTPTLYAFTAAKGDELTWAAQLVNELIAPNTLYVQYTPHRVELVRCGGVLYLLWSTHTMKIEESVVWQSRYDDATGTWGGPEIVWASPFYDQIQQIDAFADGSQIVLSVATTPGEGAGPNQRVYLMLYSPEGSTTTTAPLYYAY